jgi:hypothetical protein
MESDIPHQARLTVAASFLPHFFLENLAIRHDNSILVTVATRKELWYIPPPREGAQVDPMLLHTFDEFVSGIVEHESDIFYICTGNAYTTHEAYLHRLAQTPFARLDSRRDRQAGTGADISGGSSRPER